MSSESGKGGAPHLAQSKDLREAERRFDAVLGMESPQVCPPCGLSTSEARIEQAIRQILAQHQAPRDAGAGLPTERAMPRQNQYTAVDPIIPGRSKRPAAPSELDAREQQIWRDITRRLPAEWFTSDNMPLLKELCRHIRHADDLSVDLALARAAIDELRKTPEPSAESLAAATQEYRAVLRAHGFQSERIGNLSTKLRLTPQSRYAPSTAKREAAKVIEGPEPWDDWIGGTAEPENGGGRKQ
jgi:hypothetical protein